jgi:hypothetical protein
VQDQDTKDRQSIERAKALFASALVAERSFWREELVRHKRYDSGYFAIEMTIAFDLPDAVDLRDVVRDLPRRTMRTITYGAKPCDHCGYLCLAMGERPSAVRLWKHRLYSFAHEARPDGRELDAILSVYATLFGANVSTMSVEVVRPQRGHFEDNPVRRKGREAQEYLGQFA